MLRRLMAAIAAAYCVLYANGSQAAPDIVPVEHFARLPMMEDPKLSPGGKHYAAWASVDGNRLLAVLPTHQDGESFVLNMADYRPTWFEWGSDRYLISGVRFAYRRHGIPITETRMAVSDLEKKKVENLIHYNFSGHPSDRPYYAQFQDRLLHALPDNPRKVLVALPDSNPPYPDIFLVDMKDRGRKRVMRARGGMDYWASDAKGEVRFGLGHHRLASGYYSDVVKVLFRESEEADFQNIEGMEGREDELTFGFVSFTAQPHVIVVRALNKHKREALYLYDTRQDKVVDVLLSHELYDAADIIKAPHSDQIVGAYYHGETKEIVWFDESAESLYRSAQTLFPGRRATIVSRSRDGRRLIVRAESETRPATYHYYTFDDQALMLLGKAYPELDTNQLSDRKSVHYKARDGLTVQAYLTVPKGSDGKNLPLIMYPHGGPWVRDTAGFDYWAQYFASRGWAVIQPNFRGSSGFGKDFEDMADNEIGKAMQEDLEDAVAWLVSEGVVDAGRVCIDGASYGGYAALQGAVKTPDLYKCAVGLNGVYDLNDLVNAKRNLASFFDWKDSWRKDDAKEISPAKHAARIKIPVLIAYGEDDRTVPADESKDMIRELKKANKDVTEVKLKDGDHYLSLEKNRIQFFRAMDKFLQKHLGLGQVPLRVTEGAANN